MLAIEEFRQARKAEPGEHYTEAYEEAQAVLEDLLELTDDLKDLERLLPDDGKHTLAERRDFKNRLRALRHIAAPPISEDDLCILTECERYSTTYFYQNPGALREVLELVRNTHDRQRFPWIFSEMTPTQIAKQRDTAIIATAVLLANSAILDKRRKEATALQKEFTERLEARGFVQVKRRTIKAREEAPAPGEFCVDVSVKAEDSTLRNARAAFVIRRTDEHVIAVASRVNNSYLNGRKRLPDEAIPRCKEWHRTLGAATTAGALLSGVFGADQLKAAQNGDVHLWWYHTPEPLLEYIGYGS